jgi:hypothetical protein
MDQEEIKIFQSPEVELIFRGSDAILFSVERVPTESEQSLVSFRSDVGQEENGRLGGDP